MVAPGGPATTLVLSLLLWISRGQVAVDDVITVDGEIGHSVTLPCSLTAPDNWKDEELQIIWFRNFTDKLCDCAVRGAAAPDCCSSPDSSRTRIPWRVFGNADLEISALQESDAGRYQCWIILPDAYRRQDLLLRVHGIHNVPGLDTGGQLLGLPVTVSSWTIFLLSGWPVAVFLAVLLWSQRICIRKRQYELVLI